jgi:hypothetical protein
MNWFYTRRVRCSDSEDDEVSEGFFAGEGGFRIQDSWRSAYKSIQINT